MASGKLPGRREFLAGVASAVVLRPLSAVAEQTQQTRRIGALVGLAPSEDTPIAQAYYVDYSAPEEHA